MSRISRLSLTAVLLLAGAALVGCGDETNPVTPAQQARIMSVHASPDAPAVDLLVDNVVVANSLTYPNNTPYLTVNAGTRNVKVNLAGTSTTVLNVDFPATAGTNLSVFATGPVATIGTLAVVDDLTAPVVGKAHIRFVHLSPDAPAVDVAVTGGTVWFPNRAFEQYTPFTAVDAGTYALEVRNTGTSNVLFTVPGVTLQAGKIYTLFAKGFVAGTGAQALGAQVIVNN